MKSHTGARLHQQEVRGSTLFYVYSPNHTLSKMNIVMFYQITFKYCKFLKKKIKNNTKDITSNND